MATETFATALLNVVFEGFGVKDTSFRLHCDWLTILAKEKVTNQARNKNTVKPRRRGSTKVVLAVLGLMADKRHIHRQWDELRVQKFHTVGDGGETYRWL